MKMMTFLSKHKFACSRHFLNRYYSALYITGDKAKDNFAVLTPYIDFQERLNYKNELITNIVARNYPVDLEEVIESWNFFQSLDGSKKVLDNTRAELGQMIKVLMKDAYKNHDEIKKLKIHAKMVKEDLKNLKTHYHEVEEQVMSKVLELPNILHPRTPMKEEVILYQFLKKCKPNSHSHMKIADSFGYLEYINPLFYYLKGDASLFEQASLNYLRKYMLDSSYIQFCNPSLCRTVVAEGCGAKSIFTINESDNLKETINQLHLSGGASVLPFMAYFTKHIVNSIHLPLKYFSIAKRYQDVDSDQPKDLFNVSQESCLNIFTAAVDNDTILDHTTKLVKKFYENLGYHFLIVLLPANKIEKAESLRISIQMYSSSLDQYIEVGNISCYDNYLSKRLLFVYNEHGVQSKERRFPKVVGGTVLNVQRLLGCVLENNSFENKKLMTDVLRQNLFS